MLEGRYRLAKAIVAVLRGELRDVLFTLPVNAVVTVIDVKDGRIVNGQWNSKDVLLFAEDLASRSVPVETAGSEKQGPTVSVSAQSRW